MYSVVFIAKGMRVLVPLLAIAMISASGDQPDDELIHDDPPVISVGPSNPAHPASEDMTGGSDPETLEDAIARVQALAREGRPREEIARWLSGVLDRRVTNLNSLERLSLPENWRPWPITEFTSAPKQEAFTEWNRRQEFRPGPTAEWTWKNRIGQCSEHAGTVYHILNQAGAGGTIRIVAAPNHEFVVWGMQEGANPNDPSTWGPDAFVIDGWLGNAFSPSEVQENSYFKGGEADRNLQDVTTSFDEEAEPWTVDGAIVQAGSAEDCFVVTATYRSPLAAEVQLFRSFRDRGLSRSERGRAFITWYENTGPGLARWVRNSPGALRFTRSVIIEPAAYLIRGTRLIWEPDREEGAP